MKKSISIFLALVSVLVLSFAGIQTVFADDGDVTTAYGTIPAAYMPTRQPTRLWCLKQTKRLSERIIYGVRATNQVRSRRLTQWEPMVLSY